MAARTMDDIAVLLKSVRFKRKLFGGVDEDEVWRVIGTLQKEYRSLLDAEQLRTGALLTDRDQNIRRLEEQIHILQMP